MSAQSKLQIAFPNSWEVETLTTRGQHLHLRDEAVTVEGQLEHLELGKLVFDPKNPRLVSDDEEQELSQEECARRLLDDFDPLPIARSIAAFGFFPTDPLVGRQIDGSVIVHEGNRRLLAVRLLVDEELRDSLDAGRQWDELADGLDPQVASSLQRLPTYLVEEWEDAAPIIGVRHIVGIETWKAFEKAAFVRQLLTRTDPEGALQWASEVTGESVARLRRYLRDYQVLEQAEAAGVDVTHARERFGNFTRLLSTDGVIEYIDLLPPREMTVDTEVAFRAAPEHVAELLSYAFGTDEEDPVLTDHRRYRELGTVVASEEARDHLRRTRDLESSLALTSGIRDRVLRHLSRALDALAAASNDLPQLEPEPAIDEMIEEVKEAVDLLLRHQPIPGRAPLPEQEDQEDFDLDVLDEDE